MIISGLCHGVSARRTTSCSRADIREGQPSKRAPLGQDPQDVSAAAQEGLKAELTKQRAQRTQNARRKDLDGHEKQEKESGVRC